MLPWLCAPDWRDPCFGSSHNNHVNSERRLQKKTQDSFQEPKSLASCACEKDQHAETFAVETSAKVVLGSFFPLGVGGIGTREWPLRNGSCDRRPEKTQKARGGVRKMEKSIEGKRRTRKD